MSIQHPTTQCSRPRQQRSSSIKSCHLHIFLTTHKGSRCFPSYISLLNPSLQIPDTCIPTEAAGLTPMSLPHSLPYPPSSVPILYCICQPRKIFSEIHEYLPSFGLGTPQNLIHCQIYLLCTDPSLPSDIGGGRDIIVNGWHQNCTRILKVSTQSTL